MTRVLEEVFNGHNERGAGSRMMIPKFFSCHESRLLENDEREGEEIVGLVVAGVLI
jgi:hypothetical protein